MTPKRRSRKLRPLEINKEKKDLNSSQSLVSPNRKKFHGNTMFIGNSQKESRYLCSRVYRCRVWWIRNWLQFEFVFLNLPNPQDWPCKFYLGLQKKWLGLLTYGARSLKGWKISLGNSLGYWWSDQFFYVHLFFCCSYRYCKNKPYPKSRFCRGVPGEDLYHCLNSGTSLWSAFGPC